jgi:DNA-binding MarR family transcriptional regulator
MNWIDEVFQIIMSSFDQVFFPANSIMLKLSLQFSEPELFALMILDRNGQMSMTQIGEQVHVPLSTATGIIDRMVKRGYFVRERDESDRRAVYVSLSSEGAKTAQLIKDLSRCKIEEFAKSLTESEKATLIGIIRKFLVSNAEMALKQEADIALASNKEKKSIKVE